MHRKCFLHGIEPVAVYSRYDAGMGKAPIAIKDHDITGLRIRISGEQISQCRAIHIRPVFQQFRCSSLPECLLETPTDETSAPRLTLKYRVYITPVFCDVCRSRIGCFTVKAAVRCFLKISSLILCNLNQFFDCALTAFPPFCPSSPFPSAAYFVMNSYTFCCLET